MTTDRTPAAPASFPTSCPSSLLESLDPTEALAVIGGALNCYLLASTTCAPFESTESGLLRRMPDGRF